MRPAMGDSHSQATCAVGVARPNRSRKALEKASSVDRDQSGGHTLWGTAACVALGVCEAVCACVEMCTWDVRGAILGKLE